MRTTVNLDDDVAAAVGRVRQQTGVGVSAAVNQLIRDGLRPKPARRRFRQRTDGLGIRVDVTNVAEALEALDGPVSR